MAIQISFGDKILISSFLRHLSALENNRPDTKGILPQFLTVKYEDCLKQTINAAHWAIDEKYESGHKNPIGVYNSSLKRLKDICDQISMELNHKLFSVVHPHFSFVSNLAKFCIL